MRLLLLIPLLLAGHAFACCRFDPDTLAIETEREPGVLDVIAGRIERQPALHWNARLAEQQSTPLQVAEALTSLGRQEEAWAALDKAFAGGTSEAERAAVARMYMRVGWDAWWAGGQGELTQARALELVAEHSKKLPPNPVLDRLLRWAGKREAAQADGMLHDMLELRMAADKTIGSSNDQLQEMGLPNADGALMSLILLSPAWENFDTLYALSLAYCVQGRQHLAYYTRLRAWELYATTGTKVPDVDVVSDYRLLTVPRQTHAGALKEVLTVSGEQKELTESEFKARREYADSWLAARAAYIDARAGTAVSPLAADYWAAFTPPKFTPPGRPLPASFADAAREPAINAVAVPAPSKPEAPARSANIGIGLWLVGGGAILVLLSLLILRKRRSAGRNSDGSRADAPS